MPETTIASDIHQALDVQGDLGPEVSLDLVLLLDDFSQKSDIISTEGVDSDVRIDVRLGADLLGGGSADAAYTLRELNRLFSLGLDDAAMASYASRLGSDCAFFVYGKPMFGEGRGEILSDFPLPVLESFDLKIIAPEGRSISTADAYRGICPGIPSVSLREVLSMPVQDWKSLLVNDFERTVFALHPELAAIKQSLYDSGAIYASMSGSGSALFALYEKSGQ